MPDWIWPSILESAMKPPEDQPPSESARLPRTCIRRYGAACDTAHRSRPPVGVTDRPSAERQKFWVAFCEPSGHQSASTCTWPLMVDLVGGEAEAGDLGEEADVGVDVVACPA